MVYHKNYNKSVIFQHTNNADIGCSEVLRGVMNRLHLILHYLKVCPIREAMAGHAGMGQRDCDRQNKTIVDGYSYLTKDERSEIKSGFVESRFHLEAANHNLKLGVKLPLRFKISV